MGILSTYELSQNLAIIIYFSNEGGVIISGNKVNNLHRVSLLEEISIISMLSSSVIVANFLSYEEKNM